MIVRGYFVWRFARWTWELHKDYLHWYQYLFTSSPWWVKSLLMVVMHFNMKVLHEVRRRICGEWFKWQTRCYKTILLVVPLCSSVKILCCAGKLEVVNRTLQNYGFMWSDTVIKIKPLCFVLTAIRRVVVIKPSIRCYQ